ncbi:hypothetical protein [Micromonospora sp. DT47]|uniref:hypothetical protein n=1 Tax=Micromonospora sp. DT47 TaxID=3393431 RepID=UPI003CEA2B64
MEQDQEAAELPDELVAGALADPPFDEPPLDEPEALPDEPDDVLDDESLPEDELSDFAAGLADPLLPSSEPEERESVR